MPAFTVEFNEQTTPTVSLDLVEANAAQNTPILLTYISSLTHTLYDKATGSIINGRDDQDCLNDNNVTVDDTGRMVIVYQPEDTTLQVAGNDKEEHVSLFECTYDTGTGGTKKLKQEFHFKVRDLAKVT
jgi:hypothetical protein